MTALVSSSSPLTDAQNDYPSVMQLLTELVQTPSRGGIDDYAFLDGECVFKVDYRLCAQCRIAWVEQPATYEPYQRCGIATVGLAALRAEHPGFT